uniref:NAD(P)(+)--arginine ADP-ribosyltransferase n=1 Tax=Labrus bergylta TaxID=56723 RepID=A0A3Q3F9W8_9LABR|nr:ecto-ADP-ribosyltransferase 4-like [Labrus bergylta]
MNKFILRLLAPLLLLLWMQPAGSKKVGHIFSQREAAGAVPLSMVKDSVDDMYASCQAQMSHKVKTKYFKKENKGIFQRAWQSADKCVKRCKNIQLKDKQDEALTEEHFQAICVYTAGQEKLFELFNAAVRTNRSEYSTTFQFHSLHFWLTSAIQILKKNEKCLTSYRRSHTQFTGKRNQMIRFGSFASSSLNPKLTHFGTETCFLIQTCHGVYLKKYPRLQDKEEEVLIPPYEMFMIQKKCSMKKCKGKLSDCKVVYVLESLGFYSNLNCKAAKVDE